MDRQTLSDGSFCQVRFFKSAATVAFVLVMVVPVFTQPAARQAKPKASTSELLSEGKALFVQRCSVCHSIARKVYGPMLSKQVVIGREDAVRQQIEQGSALMPGFQYGLNSSQIDAVIEYLRSVEPPSRRVGTNNEDIPD